MSDDQIKSEMLEAITECMVAMRNAIDTWGKTVDLGELEAAYNSVCSAVIKREAASSATEEKDEEVVFTASAFTPEFTEAFTSDW